MKILMVGFDPKIIGGISNYTRPLAIELVKLGHQVFCFYSGSWQQRYNWFFRPYLRVKKKDFPFECAELVNSPNWTYNYHDPLLDISSPQIERIFEKYIDRIKPDVLHVHALCGLPISLISIAYRKGIKVFTTLHVYEMICQKMVMIDRNGITCQGPSDLGKCAVCPEIENIRKIKLFARINNTLPLLPFLAAVRKRMFGIRKEGQNGIKSGQLEEEALKTRLNTLKFRLKTIVHALNQNVWINFCVSSDVRNIFMRYGVKADKLLVNHIGSVIAKSQTIETRALHNPIVFGNIGGVGYYKGQHVILEAAERIKSSQYRVKVFGKIDDAYLKKIWRGREHLPVEFLGEYTPRDLPRILDQIDIMILPSICNDTAPQTIFESYSAGIPIIASNIGGFPDFVKDGANGYLFEPGSSKDLAAKMEKILENPSKIQVFSKNTPRLKTISENARELLDIYDQSAPSTGECRR